MIQIKSVALDVVATPHVLESHDQSINFIEAAARMDLIEPNLQPIRVLFLRLFRTVKNEPKHQLNLIGGPNLRESVRSRDGNTVQPLCALTISPPPDLPDFRPVTHHRCCVKRGWA